MTRSDISLPPCGKLGLVMPYVFHRWSQKQPKAELL
jgi:hypothetical protein